MKGLNPNIFLKVAVGEGMGLLMGWKASWRLCYGCRYCSCTQPPYIPTMAVEGRSATAEGGDEAAVKA